MAEKRRYVRLNAYVNVVWRKMADPVQPSTPQDDMAMNISEGGICLNINEKVEVGSFLGVTLQLPHQKVIHAKGRVQWIKESEVVTKRYDVGLEFLDISSQDRDEIRNFIAASLQGRGMP